MQKVTGIVAATRLFPAFYKTKSNSHGLYSGLCRNLCLSFLGKLFTRKPQCGNSRTYKIIYSAVNKLLIGISAALLSVSAASATCEAPNGWWVCDYVGEAYTKCVNEAEGLGTYSK